MYIYILHVERESAREREKVHIKFLKYKLMSYCICSASAELLSQMNNRHECCCLLFGIFQPL